MKKLFSIIALLLNFQVAPSVAVDQDTASPVRVTIELYAPGVPSSESIFVTGNTPELGNWHPSQKKMKACGDGKWEFAFDCDSTADIQYKFTLGSWDREAADDRGQPLANFKLNASESQTATHKINTWTKSQRPNFSGQITGEVRYHELAATESLKARKVAVWLPPSYESSDKRHPVIYMHDGQNLFDPSSSAFGVDWQVDETCTQLIESKEIPAIIVVGIYNTPDRSQEYLPGEIGQTYRKLLIEQLKPMIDREYRTRPERQHTFVGGSSAGGLCAFILAWEHPQVFSKAVCFSPAFKLSLAEMVKKLDYVKTVEASARPDPSPLIYIDNGGVGLEKALQPGIDEMLQTLKQKGLREDIDFFWRHYPEAHHNESAWAARFPEAIKTIMNHDRSTK